MKVLKPGLKLRSAVCSAELMVIRSVAGEFDVRCGGAPMLGPNEAVAAATPDPALAAGSLIGKRYVDSKERFELLCTKAGAGSVSIDGEVLAIKQAQALPSSD